MDPREFPTKGNLMLAKNSLALAHQGYDLMDKKRNILLKELMELIDEAKNIQEEIDITFTRAYTCLQRANIEQGISKVQELAFTVPIEESIRIQARSIMGTEIPHIKYDDKQNDLTYAFGTTKESIDIAREAFRAVKNLTIKLAEVENAAYRLAANIKKTQKRANALKNITIPMYSNLVYTINNALEEKEREVEEMKEMLLEKADKMDHLLKQAAKVLANNTEYAAMISAPQYHHSKLKFIQLSRVDERQILAVIVVEGNVIKNNLLPQEEELDDETLLKLNILLNTHLNGLSIDEINLAMIAVMKQQAGIHSDIVGRVIDAVAEAIRAEEDLEIYTSGTNNIFRYPELADQQKASELINTFEEKQLLGELLGETGPERENTGIQVYIGAETPVQSMRDCSVVTATYELGGGMKGTIGIVGPKRMDYDKVVETLRTIQTQLDALYRGGREEGKSSREIE